MSIISSFFSGNKRSVTVKKNIIGSLFVKGFSILISLLLVPLTLGYVSSELYGVWLTISSITMWLGFFDIGFTLGLRNRLTEAISLNDWKKGKSLVSTTYFIMTLIFIPLCLILMFLIPFVDWSGLLNIDIKYNDEIIKALYVLLSCFCLQMIVNVLTAVISAYQKVALSSAFPVIGNFLSLIVILIMKKLLPPSLTALAFAISAMPIIVTFIASFILYSKKFKNISPDFKSIKLSYINDLFSLGLKFFFIQIQIVVLFQCTNILISNVSGPNEVTSYNIAYKYIGTAMMLYTIILSPLWPAFTDAYVKKDFTWMRNIYKKMTYVFGITFIIVVIMVILSPFIYSIWIGEKAIIPYSMTIVVAVYMLIYSWDTLQVQLINGIGTIKLQSYVTLIGLVLHIPMSLLLGKYIGAIGVVCSMIIINIIYASFFTTQIKLILNQKAKGIWIK